MVNKPILQDVTTAMSLIFTDEDLCLTKYIPDGLDGFRFQMVSEVAVQSKIKSMILRVCKFSLLGHIQQYNLPILPLGFFAIIRLVKLNSRISTHFAYI